MKGKGIGILVVVFLIVGTAGLIWYFTTGQQAESGIIETTQPEVADLVSKTVATGSVRPRREVNVKPQVSGVVDALFVEAGEQVSQGQEVARIKLVPSEVSINNAVNAVELAKLRLENAERERARQKEVYEKKLDMGDAEARLEVTASQEERFRALLEEGLISRQEYEQYMLEARIAKTRYDNAALLAGNTLQQFENDVEIRRQELQAAINNLQLLREGASRNSRQVANVITSTVDGMILDVPVEVGSSVIERNNFNEGTTIVTVADMQALIFEGKVDESDVGRLTEGMPLRISVGALPDLTFDAVLEFIAPKGVKEDGTVRFEVRAALSNLPDVFLRAGYSANADIILDERLSVLTMAERDVIFESDTTFADILLPDGRRERRPIALGLSDGIRVEVMDGIGSDEAVIVQSGKK